MRFFSFCPC